MVALYPPSVDSFVDHVLHGGVVSVESGEKQSRGSVEI